MQLYLNFSFHILDGVGWLNLEGDGLAREGLHEDLHVEHSPWASQLVQCKIRNVQRILEESVCRKYVIKCETRHQCCLKLGR